MSSRTGYIVKNITVSYIANIAGLVLSFISRTVFLHTLGDQYLGINGLYSNVLGVLSLAELGIGSAINFALYKPVAEGNREKIKSLMALYRKAYWIIALIILVVGLSVSPFLPVIVNAGDKLTSNEIYIYYFIFLYNTVISYFVTYKFALVSAEQKGYIFTSVNIVLNIITVSSQIAVLLIFKNFLFYLLIASFIGTLSKIGLNFYLNRMYPFLQEKNVEKLPVAEFNSIKKDVTAMIIHKGGEIAIHQTDNIIISFYQGISVVGVVSNYLLIISSVSGFVVAIFNSMTASFGNVIAVSSPKELYVLFRHYKFLGFWLYGFCSIAFFVLLTPFITLWAGAERVIGNLTVFLLVTDYYLVGHRFLLNNVKSAGGVFWQDRYVAFIQAVVNVAVSIWMIKLIGLPGVYVGTVVQGLISTVIKPVLFFRHLFGVSAWQYFKQGICYFSAVILAGTICVCIANTWLCKITVCTFILRMLLVCVIPNLLFYVLFHKTDEYKYVESKVKFLLNKGVKKCLH